MVKSFSSCTASTSTEDTHTLMLPSTIAMLTYHCMIQTVIYIILASRLV